MRRSAGSAGCLAVTLVLAGCGASPVERLDDAHAALADADWSDALEAAAAGLGASPDERTAWGLELVLLEARARAGHGADALEQLQGLATRFPERLPPSQYAATADQLRGAGVGDVAIQVLDLGAKRHPDDALLAALIGAAQNAAVDPAELEMLRTLGYIE